MELNNEKNDGQIIINYLQEYDKWCNSIKNHKTIRKFVPEMVTGSIHELIAKRHMVLEIDCIHLSLFHYNKYKKYLEYK